ncbi:MAG: amidohydrolase family protein [Pseudomonadota bacterium]
MSATTWRLPFVVATLVLGSCVTDSSSPQIDSAEPTEPSSVRVSDSNVPPAIINAHFHAAYLHMDDANYFTDVMHEMDRHNIRLSVLHLNEESDVEDWVKRAPERFLAGPSFPCWTPQGDARRPCHWGGSAWPDLAWLREHYETGTLKVMGELFNVYAGIPYDDPRMMPYWALASELDIPVAVHINRGPPAGSPSRPDGCCPNFNADLGNPDKLRPVLRQYPDLRIWLQHAGFPAVPMLDNIDYLEETFALLYEYPTIYVDMTALNAALPAPVHAAALHAFIERGFGDRIMLGTDNWPADKIIERYDTFDFLSVEQRRAIFHDNATRFFNLASSSNSK